MCENTSHPPHTCTQYCLFSLSRFRCLKTLSSINSQSWCLSPSLASESQLGHHLCHHFLIFPVPWGWNIFFHLSHYPSLHLNTARFYPDIISFSSNHVDMHTAQIVLFVSLFLFQSPPWSQTSSYSAELPTFSLYCFASSHHLPHLEKETLEVTLAHFPHREYPGEEVTGFSSSSSWDRCSGFTECIKFYIGAAAGGLYWFFLHTKNRTHCEEASGFRSPPVLFLSCSVSLSEKMERS